MGQILMFFVGSFGLVGGVIAFAILWKLLYPNGR